MKGGEYIVSILEQLVSEEFIAQTHYQGAFCAAALSIISEVESPLKEQALVSLVALTSSQRFAKLGKMNRAA